MHDMKIGHCPLKFFVYLTCVCTPRTCIHVISSAFLFMLSSIQQTGIPVVKIIKLSKWLENGCISRVHLDFMHYFILDLVLQSKIWKEEFSTWATLVTSCWMYSIFEDSWRWPKPNAICWPDTKVWRHHRIWFWIHEVRSKTKICVLGL